MNEYAKGGVVGLGQVITGHPLDTLKTLSQVKSQQKIGIRTLYRGATYPLYTSFICNSVMFGVYDNLYKKNNNSVISGVITGFSIALPVNIFDFLKIKRQLNNNINGNVLTGLPFTFIREGLACGVYFSTYYTMREKTTPFISGGVSGVLSWILTYPIDTIKTRIQSGMCLKESLAKRNYFIGIQYCIIRAFLSNGIGFYIYEKL